MGEIAEMMLEGTLCQTCGEFMDDNDANGYPRSCGGCVAVGHAPVVEIPPHSPAELKRREAAGKERRRLKNRAKRKRQKANRRRRLEEAAQAKDNLGGEG